MINSLYAIGSGKVTAADTTSHPQFEPTISLLSERALLLRCSQHLDMTIQRRIWQLAQQLRQGRQWANMLEDVVPGPGSLLIRLRSDADQDLSTLSASLRAHWQQSADSTMPSRLVDIPVVYGAEHGPDLPAVAARCGLSEAEVIRLHSSRIYEVVCIGFQPGFPYLSGLDSRLYCPRRDTPRARIPAGSVAIGGQQTGIYPAATPGGWQIIGRSELKLFEPASEPPSLLQAGDRVRFLVTGLP